MERNPTTEHCAIIGTTRYGKSELALRMNAPRMRGRDRPATIWVDPAGGMAEKAGIQANHAGLFEQQAVIYDVLCETAQVPGYAFLVPSDNPDPLQRQAENRERREEAKAIILRAEGKLNDSQNPIIAEGLDWALDLFIYQEESAPFHWLRNAFDPASDEFHYLVSHCTKQDAVRTAMWYASLNGRDWNYFCSPADRRIRRICDIPAFRQRCVPSFDLASFLNAGGSLILNGASRGNLSRQDLSFMLGMILLNVIQLGRSGKLHRRTVVIVDEGMATGLIDGNIVRALAEAAKWNLEFVLIIQNPLAFADPMIRDAIFQNCSTVYFFRQVNPEAARFAAQMVAIPQLDPLKVKHVHLTERQLDDGYDEIRTTSHSKQLDTDHSTRGHTESHGTQFRARKRTVYDEHRQFFWFFSYYRGRPRGS